MNSILTATAAAALATASSQASEDCSPHCTHDHHHEAPASESSWIEKSNDWSWFDGLLSATLHGTVSYGGSTGDVSELQGGGHDPQREGWTLQGLEPGVTIAPTDDLTFFTNGVLFTNAAGDAEWEWEEVLGSWSNLPGGFELRAGQILNRVGIHNPHHLHAWSFVDAPMVSTRFLGEDGLITRSGEVNWSPKIGDPLTSESIITLSYGEVRPHEGHGVHGHDDDHDDHSDDGYESDGATFNDRVFSSRVAHRHTITDSHTLVVGANYIYGDNEFGRHNHVGGVDVEYRWLADTTENSRAVVWRTELLARNVNAISGELHADEPGHDDHHIDHEDDHDDHEEHARSGSFNELGLVTSAVATWSRQWDTGLRIGYVTGINELGLNDRLRISPNVTFFPSANRRVHVRAQYNFDHQRGHGSDHSVWLQAGIELGHSNHSH